jgi:16S rRNA (cytidine1402-2'-O)-methyltransferase
VNAAKTPAAGKLYLIPTNLGEPFAATAILPQAVIQIASQLGHFIAENPKTARYFLKNVGTSRPIQEIQITQLNVNSNPTILADLLAPLLGGHDAGLISEAGAPGIADPGADLVALAHRHNVQVVPCVGPSAILLSLMAGGLNGQRFSFHGYLAQDKLLRQKQLRELEQDSKRLNSTQLFIETPYRNEIMLADLIATLAPSTRLSIACNLGCADEWVQTKEIAQWRKLAVVIGKRPTMFSFLA